MNYQIWKNGKLASECQKEITVLSRLLKMSRKADPNKDKILVVNTNTWLSTDISEYIPTFTK